MYRQRKCFACWNHFFKIDLVWPVRTKKALRKCDATPFLWNFSPVFLAHFSWPLFLFLFCFLTKRQRQDAALEHATELWWCWGVLSNLVITTGLGEELINYLLISQWNLIILHFFAKFVSFFDDFINSKAFSRYWANSWRSLVADYWFFILNGVLPHPLDHF